MVSRVHNSPRTLRNDAFNATWHRDQWVVSACTEQGLPIPARVCEAGATDLRIQTNRPVVFGSTLRLAVCTSFHSVVAVTEGVVHHCQPADSGWWVGLFLKTRLPEDLLAAPSAENRSEIRYDVNWRAWIRPSGSTDLTSAVIQNYSMSGIRLRIPHGLETNSSVDLLRSPTPDSKPVASLRVQWCRQEGERDYCIVARIPDRPGRAVPAAFHSFGGLDFGQSAAGTHRQNGNVRADQLQFAVPNAEFSIDGQPHNG